MKSILFGVVGLVAVALGTGCDNTIDPLADGADAVFIIYGVLDTGTSRQEIRVEAVRPTVQSPQDPLADIVVTSRRLPGDAPVTWTDSVSALADGSAAHVFSAQFTPDAGTTYVVDVVRTDGQGIRATTVLPDFPMIAESLANGDSAFYSQRVVLAGPRRIPRHLMLRYVVSTPADPEQRVFEIDYGQPGIAVEAGWQFEAFLTRDRNVVLREMGLDRSFRAMKLHSVSIYVELFSQEWGPPQTSANIEGGHGFLGALGRYDVGWRLEPDAVVVAGMVDGQAPQ